jgi:polysaccharide export outer membrane protein
MHSDFVLNYIVVRRSSGPVSASRCQPGQPADRSAGRRFVGVAFRSIGLAALVLLSGLDPADAQQTGRIEQDWSQHDSSSAAAYTTSMDVLDAKRQLRIGDRLSMRIVEDRQSPMSLLVTDSGEVEVPLLGRVLAKGKTCKQLAYAIKAPLEREYYYKATVIIALDFSGLKSPGRIYIAGQVRNQGPLDIPPDETFTVSKAILRAGGFADFANRRRVKLIRRKGDSTETIIVNVDMVVNKGRTDKDPIVEADDTIIVPERLINF